MKKRIFALPIVLSSALLLGACGDGDDDINDIEVEDPTFEDDGQNDTGIDSENEGEVDTQDDQDSTTGTDGTDDTTSTETEGTETEDIESDTEAN